MTTYVRLNASYVLTESHQETEALAVVVYMLSLVKYLPQAASLMEGMTIQ